MMDSRIVLLNINYTYRSNSISVKKEKSIVAGGKDT